MIREIKCALNCSLSLSCLSFSVRSEKSLRSIHFLFIFTPFSLTCCLSTNLTAIFSIDQVVVQKVKESEITEQDSLLLIVNGGVQESFVNEKRIELEIRSLAATIMRFAKQIDQWLAASRSINTAIKEKQADEQYGTEHAGPLTLNAFDLIILSQGLNLSALFDRRKDSMNHQARFVSHKPAKVVLSSMEVVAQSMGSKTHIRNYKEIGDFENWMKTMEFDCKSISAAIYNIHQA